MELYIEILKSVESPYLKQWELQKKSDTKRIVIKHKDEVACAAFLSKMEFDPFGDHKEPYCLDLIYTREKYRKKGLATRLIRDYLAKMEVSAHMATPELTSLLEKCQWKPINGGGTYRSA